ncbi:sensor histidine kinase [Burkholderia seminalis]|uniref:sensor histidine kinase n=1 Tax=Burkholderia seminalis TaxID=488731 RepID=UPI001453CC7A|nr:ATP-binding protein [Burkholderia seminalis]VWB12722.1 two-component system sensor histidine kinase [Burkholderia seminalis]
MNRRIVPAPDQLRDGANFRKRQPTVLVDMLDHWIRSLSARLWLTSVAALAVCLGLLAAFVIHVFSHFPEETLGRSEQLEKVMHVVDGLVFDETGRLASVRLPEHAQWLFDVLQTELKYRVLDERGRVLFASGDTRDGRPWLAGDLAAASGKILQVSMGGKPFDIMTQQVPHGQAVYYVQTATSKRLNEALIGVKIAPIPKIVRVTFFVATIIFGLTLTFTVRRVLKPLRQASRAAALITPRNLTTRLSSDGIPSEIKPLINAFNEALGRLEKGYMVQQQFLASAAHELQTPLTLIRGQIELQPEIEGKELLFREIDLMARQVRQLLHLAEVSELQSFSFGEVSSVVVAQDVVSYLERRADRKRVQLQLDIPKAPSPIWADRSGLFILLKNVVENAINVSPPDSVVTLIVDDASIHVQDEGPGIRQEDLPFLFTRFWRAPDARHDGAGLGLAICKEIALAHDWQLTVSSPGKGARFTVLLQA